MQIFIENKMKMIFDEFKKNLEDETKCCNLKTFRFDSNNIPNYNNLIIEQYYLLRYLPAYFVEYFKIYQQIIESDFLGEEFNVLSLGCGAGIDLWGCQYALENNFIPKSVDYTGVDIVSWKYWDKSFANSKRYILNIGNMARIGADFNIIIFPKSIGEFKENDFEELKNLIATSKFNNNKIILISSQRKTRLDNDINRTNEIVKIMKEKKYQVIDDSDSKYYYFSNKKNGYPFKLEEIVKTIKYPEEVKWFLNKLYKECQGYKNNNSCCYEDCEELLSKNPITTMSQVKYSIIKLERSV